MGERKDREGAPRVQVSAIPMNFGGKSKLMVVGCFVHCLDHLECSLHQTSCTFALWLVPVWPQLMDTWYVEFSQ